MVKIRSYKKRANSNEIKKAPRVTLKLVIYIIAVQITQVSYSIDMINNGQSEKILVITQISKVIRWVQDYCPIVLLYFHPAMVAK